MVFWLVLGLMTAAAIAVVVRPLLRRAPSPAADADGDLAVYRDQLAEIERDLSRGVLAPPEAGGYDPRVRGQPRTHAPRVPDHQGARHRPERPRANWAGRSPSSGPVLRDEARPFSEVHIDRRRLQIPCREGIRNELAG